METTMVVFPDRCTFTWEGAGPGFYFCRLPAGHSGPHESLNCACNTLVRWSGKEGEPSSREAVSNELLKELEAQQRHWFPSRLDMWEPLVRRAIELSKDPDCKEQVEDLLVLASQIPEQFRP